MCDELLPPRPEVCVMSYCPPGLNFIWKKAHYRCEVCPEVRLSDSEQTEEHFKSLDHYNNMVAHLTKIEVCTVLCGLPGLTTLVRLLSAVEQCGK